MTRAQTASRSATESRSIRYAGQTRSLGLSVMPGVFGRVAALTLAASALAVGPAVATPVSLRPVTSNVPVYWAGEAWTAKNSPVVQQGPAPNYWLASPSTVFTDDAGRLHLVA